MRSIYPRGLLYDLFLLEKVAKPNNPSQKLERYFDLGKFKNSFETALKNDNAYHCKVTRLTFYNLVTFKPLLIKKLNELFYNNLKYRITAINIAKVEHWLSIPKEVLKPFSMADIKTMNHIRLLLLRFIDVFGINAYSAKNRNHVNELIYYGTIDA